MRVRQGGPDGGPEGGPGGVFAATREGLAFVRQHRLVLALTVGFWAIVATSGPDDLLLPFLGARDLHASPLAIGVLVAGASVGVVGGLAAMSRWGGRADPARSIIVGMALVAVGNGLTALAPVVAVAVVTQIVRGIGIAIFEPNLRTLLQRSVPRHLTGRVFATVYGGVGVAAGLSYAVGGPLLDATSARTMFAIVGFSGAVATTFTALRIRRATGEPAPPGSPPAVWTR